jgi:hypothetical protein
LSHVLTTLARTEQRQLPWERVSKKVENHAAAIALYFMYYNFGRIHQTLHSRNGSWRGQSRVDRRGNRWVDGMTNALLREAVPSVRQARRRKVLGLHEAAEMITEHADTD